MDAAHPWRSQTSSSLGAKQRVLLDTNVWSYVIDSGASGELLRAVRDSSKDVQIAPAVVYETLRMSNVALRDARIKLMTNRRFKRLMPEAYSESMEILREIERVRPEWLSATPDLNYFTQARADWQRKLNGFWVRCEKYPAGEAAWLASVGDSQKLDAARAQTKNARQEMQSSGWKSNPPMDKTLAGYSEPLRGWRGDMVEAWRWDSWSGLSYALGTVGNAYRDWIAPFLGTGIKLLDSAEWVEFWLYEASKENLPRQWLRWGHEFSQRFRSVTPGSPGDVQLSTYFVETDMVISGDGALLDILEQCRPYAPCQLPKGLRISSGAPGVHQLLEVLQS
jgi:hypothetical protein